MSKTVNYFSSITLFSMQSFMEGVETEEQILLILLNLDEVPNY